VVVYTAELVLKLLAYGASRFGRSRLNLYDALITVVTCVMEFSYVFGAYGCGARVPVAAPSSVVASCHDSHRLTCVRSSTRHAHINVRVAVRAALVLRLLRLLRVLVALKRFNHIFAIFVTLLPSFATMFGMLWAIFNFFAEVGIALFGGKIWLGNPLLNGTGFQQAGYEANNFNDYGSACMTLFELLVVNNWHILMEGFVAVTDKRARFFFIVFYTVAVIMVINLIVAFVLDAFFRKVRDTPTTL
jgi:hypothetical protein